MILKVPQSLINHIRHLELSIAHFRRDDVFQGKELGTVIRGTYGTYRLEAVDDKEYTVLIKKEEIEKIIVHNEVREYKE